jgi:hypothetical protein
VIVSAFFRSPFENRATPSAWGDCLAGESSYLVVTAHRPLLEALEPHRLSVLLVPLDHGFVFPTGPLCGA